MENLRTQDGKDEQLWKIARQRASFKKHLTTYLIMIVFFWLIWYFSGGQYDRSYIPWPLWAMIGWGLGLAFHYMNAYVTPTNNAVEKEYEKLLNEQKNKK